MTKTCILKAVCEGTRTLEGLRIQFPNIKHLLSKLQTLVMEGRLHQAGWYAFRHSAFKEFQWN